MSVPKLPAVHLPPPVIGDGQYVVQDAVILDLPPSNKFSFSWPSDTGRPTSTTPPSERPAHSSSEAETDTSEAESVAGHREADQFEDSNATPTTHLNSQLPAQPNHPWLPRAFSVPLPSQLGHLQNPHRPEPASSSKQHNLDVSLGFSQFHELSLELADSVQMVIQTMLQISPPQVLDAAKEQFSACSLSVPTSSMSAMFTAMKNLNYISANMASFCVEPSNIRPLEEMDFVEPLGISSNVHNDFDIGEMLQSVGDALSGTAAQAGVDLVLFHGDVGMKHASVKGDENGISYTLSHVIRQILSTSHQGDSIELGLFIRSIPPQPQEASTRSETDTLVSDDDFRLSGSPVELDGPVRCTVEISHKFCSSDSFLADGELSTPRITQTRPVPSFSTLLLRRLLHKVGASLVPDLKPKNFAIGRTCELTLTLERGASSAISTAATTSQGDVSREDVIASEPTLEQLTIFSESLRGKKVTLYASSKGSFAHHLTSYLTAWGMDVSHVSSEGGVEGCGGQPESASNSAPTLGPRPTASNSLLSMYSASLEGFAPSGVPSKAEARHAGPQPFSFIFIDDDVDVLKERLDALRVEQPYQLNLSLRKRPPLAAHHRPRSSPQIARALGQTTSVLPTSSVVIVHFTSLSNYKMIKDVIQSVLASYSGSSARIPEVMIILKPAGPRRFLTALHTAITKPAIDPFFEPIATSPGSPGLRGGSSFFGSLDNTNNGPKSSATSQRPSKSRSNSDRSTRSSKDIIDHANHPPPSPLGMTDTMEYFSAEAVKLGTSPSSGLMIQSPDGQPAGIFFHPRAKTQRNPSSSLTMERDQGQLSIPSDRRPSTSRVPSGGDGDKVTFSILHEVVSSSTPHPAGGSTPSPPRSKGRKQTSPRTEEFSSLQVPSVAVACRPSPSENPARKVTTPPGSPLIESKASTSTRRAVTRRSTQENRVSTPPVAASRKGKTPADGNIVPPISVLIVDDNPINQTILSTFMRKKKIKYDVAGNGQEAVQKWRTGEFHLILMDIQMPVMDGIQATKEIRRLEKTNASAGYPPTTPSLDDQRTPPVRTPSDASTESRSTSSPYRSSVIIVALTASSLQSDRVAALAAGCNDFLTKPVSLLWLNSKIIEWGSIKALQMWADLRPDVAKTISTGQAAQARNVAERLHVPKGRSTPSPSHPSTLSGGTRSMENVSPAMLVPPMTGVPPDSAVPISTTSSAFWSPAQPSPTSFWGGLGIPSPAVNHNSRSNSTQVSPVVNTNYPSSQPWHPPSTDAPRAGDGTSIPRDPRNTEHPTDSPDPVLVGDSAQSSDDDLAPKLPSEEPSLVPAPNAVLQPSQ